MKTVTTKLFLILSLWMVALPAEAGTRIQTLVLESEDGDQINGFLYQSSEVAEDAPIALLLHGLTGSNLHWLASGYPSYGGQLSDMLLAKGYRVVAIDARAHGTRKNELSPIDRVKKARKGDSADYTAMIKGTISDYGVVIERLQKAFPKTKRIVAVGYSMGAQMSVLLAANNEAIDGIVTMVPPFVSNVPEVAPINSAHNVEVPWLLITANKDQFSSKEQNLQLAEKTKATLTHKTYDSGHVLPVDYLADVENWITALEK